MSAASPLPATRPVIEIDLDALVANYRMLAEASAPAEAAAVVKCNAYGLGAAEAAEALALGAGCATFFVAYAEEGASLRRRLARSAPHAAIYVFNGPHTDSIALFRDAGLRPVLNTLQQAELWAYAAPAAPAALHIDTGMNRLGLSPGEAPRVAAIKGLTLDLVMSHLACSSSPGHDMNDRQLDAFVDAARIFPGARLSLAASSGALLPARFHFAMTRLGVGLYGASPLDQRDDRIRPVARLTAPVLQIREARAGESVGYGAGRILKADTRLAVVALGYGDGFLRAGGDRAAAFIGGTLCPVAGRISMDLITLDVSAALQPVGVGDRAEFFGQNLPIEVAAASCGTLGYELLTGLGARLHRRYFWSGAPADIGAPQGSGA